MSCMPRPNSSARSWLAVALMMALPLGACTTDAPSRTNLVSDDDDDDDDERGDGADSDDAVDVADDTDAPGSTSGRTRPRDAGAARGPSGESLQRGDGGGADVDAPSDDEPVPAGDPDDLS